MSADMKPSIRANIRNKPLRALADWAVGLAPLPADNKGLNPRPGIAAFEPPEFLDQNANGVTIPAMEAFTMTRKIAFGLALGGMLSMLAGCGYDPGARAVTGGLMGAGAGAGCGSADRRQAGDWRADRWRRGRRRRRRDPRLVGRPFTKRSNDHAARHGDVPCPDPGGPLPGRLRLQPG